MSINRAKVAVKQMREMSHAGIPFSITYQTFNHTKGTSKGTKVVDKAILRKGYKKDQSSKSDMLIAYKDINTGEERQFYLPLLLKFNKICLI
jgi:hypothetical protein